MQEFQMSDGERRDEYLGMVVSARRKEGVGRAKSEKSDRQIQSPLDDKISDKVKRMSQAQRDEYRELLDRAGKLFNEP
jgi:hypothetical protein